MDAERHALLARRLMDACGGANAIGEAGLCRVAAPSQLHRYGDPTSDQFMPADVMAVLERHAGAPIYSLAIAEEAAISGDVDCLVTEGMVATERAADLQRSIREAAKDGILTPAEKRRLRRHVIELQEQFRVIDAAIGPTPIEGGEGGAS